MNIFLNFNDFLLSSRRCLRYNIHKWESAERSIYMKKFWKTVAFLGTAALAVTGGICLIRKFFNPDEELDDFDDDDLFEEDDEDTDEVEAFDNDAEIFEDESEEAPAEENEEKEEKTEEAEDAPAEEAAAEEETTEE